MYYRDKQRGWMYNDYGNKNDAWYLAICLLDEHLTRTNREHKLKHIQKKRLVIQMGRICVEIPDELEKKLRFKTVERFGGKKGDLSKAVEESVRTWVALDK
jgi:hypothetical protein